MSVNRPTEEVAARPPRAVPSMTFAAAARRATTSPWLLAFALAAAHVVLKAPRLGASSLWLDEAVAVHIAQLDPLGIIQASRDDTTPPLYDLLLGGFERLFGISEVAVRWPSVLASSATAGVLFLLARRRLGVFAAWLASVLFILSDINLRFAREARPYALASLLCVLSFALLFRAVERRSRRAWAAVAVVNGLMLFTHYATVFVVLTQAFALLWRWRADGAPRRFAMAHVIPGVAWVAWTVPLMLRGRHHNMDWMPRPRAGHLFSVLGWLTGGLRGGPGFWILLVGAGIALIVARSRGRRVPWDVVATVASWGLGPIVLAFITSFFVRCFHARYLMFVTPGLLLLWAAAAQALPSRRLRAFGASIACAVTLIGFGRSARSHVSSWREAVELLRARPADRVLVVPGHEAAPFAYYYDPGAFRDPSHTRSRLAAEGVRLIDAGLEVRALDLDGARELVLVVAGKVPLGGFEAALMTRGFSVVEKRDLVGIAWTRFRASGAPEE